MPDRLYDMSEMQRKDGARYDSDRCRIGSNNFFVKGVLHLPLQGAPRTFVLGLWAKISRADFRVYLEHWNRDGTAQPPFVGHIANASVGYPGLLHHEVMIQLGPVDQRPTFQALPGHCVAQEQKDGVTRARVLELLTLYHRI